jgi:hypothetical protein
LGVLVVALQWANIALALKQTGTSYDSATLTTIAAQVEQDIIAELILNSLPSNPPLPGQPGYVLADDTGVQMLVKAAQMWLDREIRILQKHDGSFYDSLAEGTLKISLSINESINFYDTQGREALDKYIRSNTGAELDEGDDYAGGLFLAGEDL